MTAPSPSGFPDSHCHLSDARFDTDRAAVLERAWEAGLDALLLLPVSPDDLEGPARLAATDSRLKAAAGIHPHHARVWSSEVRRRVEAALDDPSVRVLGEIGLDFHYDNSPRDDQRRAFREQVELAAERGFPVAVHSRLAREETLAMLERAAALGVGGAWHCFSEDAETARRAHELGFLVSFSGIVTFPGAAVLREAARALPAGALLVETDAPYLAPVPHRGARNEPAYAREVLLELARCRGEDPAVLASTVGASYRALIGSAPAG